MNQLSIFFNTKVEDSGKLAWIGDMGLVPFRYLFNGSTALVEFSAEHPTRVQCFNSCRKDERKAVKMLKTIVAILLVVPGVVLGLTKILAYAYRDVRNKHNEVFKDFDSSIRLELGVGDAGPSVESLVVDNSLNKNIKTLIINKNNKSLQVTYINTEKLSSSATKLQRIILNGLNISITTHAPWKVIQVATIEDALNTRLEPGCKGIFNIKR